MELNITLKEQLTESEAALVYELAKALAEGDAFEEDEALALQLYAAAAKAGHVRSYGHIGEMLEDTDLKKAMLYYKKGASLGDVFSMVQLGCYYEEQGHAAEALLCYEMAAKEEEPEAMYRYGLLITDPDEKVNWLRKSANAGYFYAPRALGEVYEMKENANLALFWYRQGMEQGDHRLAEKIRMLELESEEEIDVVIEYDDEETM